ncbi:MAG: flagellar hook assembly protein FlgD [Pseudomonadota bacterium]
MINSTSTVTGTTGTTSTTGTAAVQESEAGSQDRFLKLLVAQMQNQDPMNPMDNSEVTSQMAQINTVKGIERLNASVTSMATGFNAAQPLQAAALVGHTVLAPGSAMQLSGGQAQGGATLGQSAETVSVAIKDSTGAVIRTMALGPQKAGDVRFTWDGATDSGAAATNGTYQFSVTAQAGGQKVETKALTVAQVTSVTPSEKGVTLTLGALGDFSLSQIKQIF